MCTTKGIMHQCCLASVLSCMHECGCQMHAPVALPPPSPGFAARLNEGPYGDLRCIYRSETRLVPPLRQECFHGYKWTITCVLVVQNTKKGTTISTVISENCSKIRGRTPRPTSLQQGPGRPESTGSKNMRGNSFACCDASSARAAARTDGNDR